MSATEPRCPHNGSFVDDIGVAELFHCADESAHEGVIAHALAVR